MIRLEGLLGVVESLAKHEIKLEAAGAAGMAVAAEQVKNAWVTNIIEDELVLTGRYRDSVHIVDEGLEAHVVSEVPYAPILEFGDSRQAAHYPATRAADESHEHVIDAVAESVGKVL